MRICVHARDAYSWSVGSRESAPVHVCCGVFSSLSLKMSFVSCLWFRHVSFRGISLADRKAAGSVGIVGACSTLRAHSPPGIAQWRFELRFFIASNSYNLIVLVACCPWIHRHRLIINPVLFLSPCFHLFIIGRRLLGQLDLVDAGLCVQAIFE